MEILLEILPSPSLQKKKQNETKQNNTKNKTIEKELINLLIKDP